MKNIFTILFIIGFTAFAANTQAQVMLQKAVVSNGGGVATNGTTNAIFIAGQPVAGTASNGQIVGQFGFFATPLAANLVEGQGAGPINSVTISPNPATIDLSIKVELSSSSNIDLYLYDASGHLVSTLFSGRKEAGSFIQKLDTRSLASGTYFVAARVPGALLETKVTIVK